MIRVAEVAQTLVAEAYVVYYHPCQIQTRNTSSTVHESLRTHNVFSCWFYFCLFDFSSSKALWDLSATQWGGVLWIILMGLSFLQAEHNKWFVLELFVIPLLELMLWIAKQSFWSIKTVKVGCVFKAQGRCSGHCWLLNAHKESVKVNQSFCWANWGWKVTIRIQFTSDGGKIGAQSLVAFLWHSDSRRWVPSASGRHGSKNRN